MKKIINGIRYNTDKAIKIGEYDNIGDDVQSVSDFQFWEAALYKTPQSGRFFLAGGGGYMSHYRGGTKITPMTRNEALEWAEQFLDTDTIEQYFEDIIKDA